MERVRHRLAELVLRVRILRYQDRQRRGHEATRRHEEHLERVRAGIKDIPPPGLL